MKRTGGRSPYVKVLLKFFCPNANKTDKYIKKSSPESLGDEVNVRDIIGIVIILIGVYFVKEAIEQLVPHIDVIAPGITTLAIGLIAIIIGGGLLLGKR